MAEGDNLRRPTPGGVRRQWGPSTGALRLIVARPSGALATGLAGMWAIGSTNESFFRLSLAHAIYSPLGIDAQHAHGKYPGAQPAGRDGCPCAGHHPQPALRRHAR